VNSQINFTTHLVQRVYEIMWEVINRTHTEHDLVDFTITYAIDYLIGYASRLMFKMMNSGHE